MPETAVSIDADLRRILWVQAIRAFLYGFAAVVLGTGLAKAGVSVFAAGLVFAAMLAGMGIAALIVGGVGDRLGRRRTYTALLATMGVFGIVFALTDNVWILGIAALFGTMSPDYNDNGPMTTLEQAMIAEAPAAARVRVFGRYNAVAYLAGAVGGLAAGGPVFIREIVRRAPADQRWLLLFPVGAAICAVLAGGLSKEMERSAATSRTERPLQRSRGTVYKLSALFSIDSFAGGFVVPSLIVLWFEVRFHTGAKYMSVVIFVVGLLQALSSVIAPRIAGRIGLLNTMVLTHLPSNIFLILVAVMPNLPLATAALLLRSSLSQMDVPTRQAYIAAMVDPRERTAAAGVTNTSRYLSRPLGPVIGTALMQNVATGAPFVVAGAVKSAYDFVLWTVFRRVPLPEGERS